MTSPQSYAELQCKSNFSFLEGASHPDELVQRAAELNYAALAITDRHSLAGVVRAHVAAKPLGIKLLIGAQIDPVDGPAVVLLAMNRQGYGRLSSLITQGRRQAAKGSSQLTVAEIAAQAADLIACIDPRWPAVSAGTTSSTAVAAAQAAAQAAALAAVLAPWRDAFADRTYLLAHQHLAADDRRHLHALQQLSAATAIPLVAAGDVHYHTATRQPLQDVLTAIRHRCPVSELGERRFSNAQRHLQTLPQIQQRFATAPQAIARTVEIAERCQFSLDELRYEYPHELCPPGSTPPQHLAQLTWAGAAQRYPAGIPDSIRDTIERELKLIQQMQYEAYFLTVWDLVRFARSRDILCQGRGSAANSAVCYCLGITAVDPTQIDLLFERFISLERAEPPDIDVDFEHQRREEVIQYIYDKYGRHRAAMTGMLITYRPRSAIRDVGKALGLSLDRIDKLAKNLDHHGGGDSSLATRFRESGLNPQTRLGKQCLWLTEEILGFPRHHSQHVGGMVITEGLLHELVPIENAAMPDRTVIQWDKDDLDALGLLKVDCLALGMLTAIRKSFDLIRQHHDRALTLATVPIDDTDTYQMIQQADTVGVFQIESRAQMSMLPRLKPERFYDLVIEVALVRPGPIQGDMVHPYLRRRRGEEAVAYPDAKIEAVLRKTLGVPLFQEQAMKLSQVAAGFTPDESDRLRRAMAAWKRKGGLEPFRQKLLDGMAANGYEAEFAERLYRQICGFGEYGFPESHAASFAALAYVSAWLKCHYPAAFCASLINSQPMGFYRPSQLVTDARNHRVEVRPVDVNHSQWDCSLEPAAADTGVALRLGLRMISGFAESAADRIVAARQSRVFESLDDFSQRSGLSRALCLRLSRADAFASLSLHRRAAIWDALPEPESRPLLRWAAAQQDSGLLPFSAEPDCGLLPLSAAAEVAVDYQTLELSLKAHPLSFLRQTLASQQVICASELADVDDGQLVSVAGLVLLRQRPGTAKGVTFMTLEDETGQTNLVVWQRIWQRQRRLARTASALIVSGTVQKADGVIHVVVQQMQDLSAELDGVAAHSRDFR